MDVVQDELNRSPPLALSVVVASVVVGLVLNPVFAFDDAFAFCPRDVLFRAQIHRVFTSVAHVDGPLSALLACALSVRVIARRERERGTLRTLFDGATVFWLTTGCATVISVILGPIMPVILRDNYMFGTGVFAAAFGTFARECARASASDVTQLGIVGAVPTKRAPAVVGFVALLLGANALELASCLYVGYAWGSRGAFEWANVSDGTLADLENGSLRLIARAPGYVAVNGQTLPVTTRDGAGVSATSWSTFAGGVFAAASVAAREVRSRVVSQRRTEGAAARTTAAETSDQSSASEQSGDEDTRPKPDTREERAAAFAAALERRKNDTTKGRHGEDEGDAAS